jgi:NAD(P)-dependent dehydrogenase (short-subunit alcohol dehydrogenase family)
VPRSSGEASRPRVALVTGANRGIGFEVCRQLSQRGFIVVLGSRDEAKGIEAADRILRERLTVVPYQVDVTDLDSIEHARARLVDEIGRLDVLVNNARIHYDDWQRVLDADMNQVREAFETNTLGAWHMTRAFLPLLRESEHGRIVNVSSGAGSLASMGARTPAYVVSKVGLNALTRMLSAELQADKILVNSVCPGWVSADRAEGGRPVDRGAASIVWAATLPDTGPTGGFFRDGRAIPW